MQKRVFFSAFAGLDFFNNLSIQQYSLSKYYLKLISSDVVFINWVVMFHYSYNFLLLHFGSWKLMNECQVWKRTWNNTG